ncbi:MAG: DUF1343 domain-containing protein [Verrucomicrobiota bacterium]|nr:DUF1343 domain-containing protein [Verrucomicrobiota bacterium]
MALMKAYFFLLLAAHLLYGTVVPGVEVFFTEKKYLDWKGKKIGLITNHTGIDSQMRSTLELFVEHQGEYQLAALFSPEHGLFGQHYAWESVDHQKWKEIPVYSLHGVTRRPTSEMLKGIDILIYDIQCTGVRAYTYPTTLFYAMEEAAKRGIEVVVLDRPNPINGIVVDGLMLEDKWRSFIGYVNVPYCHGMTIGELAQLFNSEYKIGCKLKIVPMKGWKRKMSFAETGLAWIPPSPNVPEPDTPLYCPTTGLLGELQISNIGIGFTLPFKVVGAPWIDANEFAEKLNAQKLPGVQFQPYCYKPFWGLYKGIDCQGVLIRVTDSKIYRPVAVQYLILGMLKSLYPKEFMDRLTKKEGAKDLFCKANGTEMVYRILSEEKYPAWKLIDLQKEEREKFLEMRAKYLIYLENQM